jgi:hypothetical protein
MVLKRSWPLTRGWYISQIHIDCMVSIYGSCSIFTCAHIIIIISEILWVLIFMESNKRFFASFFMALNKLGGTMYTCNYFLPPIPQSILYYTLFHIIHVTIIAKTMFCSKCPSDTFSKIFLLFNIFILVQLSF